MHVDLRVKHDVGARKAAIEIFERGHGFGAAAKALAELISDDELSAEYIIPKAFDKRVGPAVAKAVAEAAKKSGVARL